MKIIGNGQIETVKKGKAYKIRHSLGRDPETGAYLRTSKRTFYGTKAEAREFALLWKQELESGLAFNPNGLTVAQYAEAFQAQREAMAELSPLTLRRDGYVIQKIVELFGDTMLNDLDTGTINRAYAKLRSNGASLDIIHRIHKKLSQLLKQAVAEQVIAFNPCDPIHFKQPKPKERKSFTLEEATRLAQILKEGEQAGNAVAVWLALATGIRRGEALGLTWKDVDLKRGRIFISQQYTTDKALRPPKSDNANRWISIDEGTVRYLTYWKEKQCEQLSAFGMEQTQGTPVASNELGEFTDPNNFNRWRRVFFAEHGFGSFKEVSEYTDAKGEKRIRRRGYEGHNFHELRHTQATLLIGTGADIKTVQKRLGHSSASLTMDIYAHAIAQNDRAAADSVGEMFNLSGSKDDSSREDLALGKS